MKGSEAGLETGVRLPSFHLSLGQWGARGGVLSQGVTEQDCGLSGYGGAEDELEA